MEEVQDLRKLLLADFERWSESVGDELIIASLAESSETELSEDDALKMVEFHSGEMKRLLKPLLAKEVLSALEKV